MTKPERQCLWFFFVIGLMGWALITAPWWERPLDEVTEYHDVPSCVHQGKLP